MLAHLSGIPRDLAVLRPDLPRAVVRVVTRAMARDPEKRFGAVSEFVAALRAASGQPERAAPVEPSAPQERRTGRSSRVLREEPEAEQGEAEEDSDDDGRGGWLGWLRRRRD